MIETSLLQRLISDVLIRVGEKGEILDILSGEGSPLSPQRRMELKGKSLEHLLPRSVVKEILDLVRISHATGGVKSLSFRMNLRGEERHVDAKILSQRSGNGGGERSFLLLRDVTDSRRATEYGLLIEKIFKDATEAILILSKKRHHAQFNEAFCHMFGVAPHEPLEEEEKIYARFFGSELAEAILETLQRYGTYRGEVSFSRVDGSTLSGWLSIDTVYDDEEAESFRVVMLTDISELQESREMLRFAATHDALTGLPNRRMLLKHIEHALQRSIRYRHSGAVFFIDLDNFKIINDTLGHVAGDAVLIECAARIRSIIRKSDIFGRLGGDEFLLITEEIKSPDALMHIAQKIIGVLNKPFYIGDLKHTVGASIGVSIFPQDSRDRDELLQFADMAMYRAKQKGKNRYQFYSSRMDNTIRRHFQIEKALQYALDHNGLYLVFQPQIDLSSEVVVGLEALVRIDEKIAGPLYPTEFIPIAEESDLILRIGRWVFTRVCQMLYSWRGKHPLDGLRISVNLSQRQLADETWVDFVRQNLERYYVDPDRIEFEITETAFMQSEKTGRRTIRRLQELGCKISIDDFGTGYSSLATLKEFTVDKLKIDKSFIEEIASNPTDRTIVKASIAMAHAMGLNTIAEGIETDDQKRVVQLMGCREMQGYLFSEPKRSRELFNFLKEMQRKK